MPVPHTTVASLGIVVQRIGLDPRLRAMPGGLCEFPKAMGGAVDAGAEGG